METQSDLCADGQRGAVAAEADSSLNRLEGNVPAGRHDPKVAGAVHDLNNVLTIVLGSLEQLQRQPLDETGQRHLHRAFWGARQTARLCKEALSAAGREAPAAEAVDLNQVVEEFHQLIGESVSERIVLKLQLAPQPLPVRLHACGLELALLNLLRNAIDASPEGGSLDLETAAKSENMAEVSVKDTGSGMPAHVASRATARLYTTKERGSGLGLWMVQQFVTDGGGKVVIETEDGRGTTVRLRFPLAGAERTTDVSKQQEPTPLLA